ncbi:OPT oligopeptide transporter protein-domain-containing protein [Dipodascopsis uninucleata]
MRVDVAPEAAKKMESSTNFDPSDNYTEKVKEKGVTIKTFQRYEDRDTIIDRIKHSDDLEDVLDEDVDFIIEKLATMEDTEAIDILNDALIYYDDDINFPRKTHERIRLLLQGEEAYGMGSAMYDLDLRLQATLMKYHSPYPEVRAVCSPIDDPTMQVETFRVYLIGCIWTGFAAFVNTMIYFRQPHFSLTSQVVQLLIYPSGVLYSKVIPNCRIGTRKYGFDLNPGPWTFKEQMLATIMANAGVSIMNAMYYTPTVRNEQFYGLTWVTYGYNVLIGFATQTFGLSVAGMLRRWVIYPSRAVWPTILPTLQLNRTLILPRKKSNVHGWTITGYKFFYVTMGCAFIYFFIPNYLFTALSLFNWMTWIAPQNKNLAIITGSRLGLGFNPISSFDWTVVNYSSPLIVPFYTVLNRYIGTIIGGVAVAIIYYTNYMYTGYMPINTASVYDRFGKAYNITRVQTNGRFDLQKYMNYSQPFMSAGHLLYSGATYAVATFGFVYVILNEWKAFKLAFIGVYRGIKERKSSNYEQYNDPISRHMRNYPEVPDWWYLIWLFVSLGLAIVAIRCFPTEVPIWVLIATFVITVAMIIPSMVMYASTGYLMTVYLLGTLLGGYWVPGSGIACIYTRMFGYSIDEQAESYVGDQKLGHYAKIPPRSVYRAQFAATVVQVFASAGGWQMLQDGVAGLCTYDQVSRFTCPFSHTLFSESVMIGLIGPKRTFDQLYPILKYAFLMGALFAVPCWYIRLKFPALRYWHPVIMLGGFSRYGTTYNLSYYTPGFYAAWVFNYYIRGRYVAWWAKYNYLLSSGLTAGVAFCGILIFVALQYKPKQLNWWGNSVSTAGLDSGQSTAILGIPEDRGYFGPDAGTWY